MRPFAATVPDQRLVVATGVEQGVGEDGEAGVVQSTRRQFAVLVGALGDAAYRAVVPGEDGRR
jgi:hypothetical protein